MATLAAWPTRHLSVQRSLSSYTTSMFAVSTIVARNYLPYARVLMESVRRHNPEAARIVLVTDGDDTVRVDGCQVLTPIDLFADEEELRRQAFMYDVMEFATALKPLLLKHLLGKHERAVFIDPDCRLFNPLPSERLADDASLAALTPHRITPPPLDGLYPDEQLVKTFGVFNLGFAEANINSHPLLDWWASRLRRHGGIEPSATLYTDQRWMDLAPGYFDVTVVRHPGFNVAPWNIDERDLGPASDAIVGDSPLVFAHFSGVRPPGGAGRTLPARLRLPNARVNENPSVVAAFEDLCMDYVRAVMNEGLDEARASSYGWGSYADGRPIPLRARRLYRREVIRAELERKPPPAPPMGRTLLAGSARLDFLERSRFLEASRSGWQSDVHRVRSAGFKEAWRRTGGSVVRRGT